jgi:hypothetical protein
MLVLVWNFPDLMICPSLTTKNNLLPEASDEMSLRMLIWTAQVNFMTLLPNGHES